MQSPSLSRSYNDRSHVKVPLRLLLAFTLAPLIATTFFIAIGSALFDRQMFWTSFIGFDRIAVVVAEAVTLLFAVPTYFFCVADSRFDLLTVW